MANPIKIIDLFAGPGGLGEGFSAVRSDDGKPAFKIKLSIEKDANAHRTLQLRAFYRQFEKHDVPKAFYDYLSHKLGEFPEDQLFKENALQKQIKAAREEARLLTLGEDNIEINNAIEKALTKRPGPWVLIGGPPCQAYSIAGRSRNKGNKGYRPEEDHRNFLYKEYLEILSRYQPDIFVMENVKGMLSARIGGQQIFEQIRIDLENPTRATATGSPCVRYELFTLTQKKDHAISFDDVELSSADFIIHAEKHGIPQARHRVILIGIKSSKLSKSHRPGKLGFEKPPTARSVIANLPKLRSTISREPDSFDNWVSGIRSNSETLIDAMRKEKLHDVADIYNQTLNNIGKKKLNRGSNWHTGENISEFGKLNNELADWYTGGSGGWRGICNHESRAHMKNDLHRYLFCASYAKAKVSTEIPSPKAHHFPEAFWPDHANWRSGHFNDRFKVQARNRPGTTITSHISKDGHYFIHYDPTQCRSLTVREAARIQTFPDNYFFVGTRTAQYTQVGNAVPPYLAYQIANIVYAFLRPED